MEERATDVDGPSRDEDGVVGTGSILTLVLTLLLTSHLPRMNHILGLVGPTVATMFAGEPLKWLIATVSFALAVLFVMVDVVGDAWSDRRRHLVRRTCLVGIVLSLVVLPLLFNVHVRHRSGDHRSQYDGLLQEEIAVAWVLNGQNPYAEDFGGTVVDSGRYDSVFRDLGYDRNPALAHYPYMPFNVVFALPFAILMDAAVGFYDHRIVLLISYCLLDGRDHERCLRLDRALAGCRPRLGASDRCGAVRGRWPPGARKRSVAGEPRPGPRVDDRADEAAPYLEREQS